MGVSKKSAAGGVLGGDGRWEGYLKKHAKKPDVIRSPRNKRQKNEEVPVQLGFLGLPIDRSKGPRRNFQEVSEGCDVQLAIELGHPGRRYFPEVASCY